MTYEELKQALVLSGPITSKELALRLGLPTQSVAQKLRYLYVTSQIFRELILVGETTIFLWRAPKRPRMARVRTSPSPRRVKKPSRPTKPSITPPPAVQPVPVLEKGVTLEDVRWMEAQHRDQVRARKVAEEWSRI